MNTKIIESFISQLHIKSNNFIRDMNTLNIAVFGEKAVATIPVQKPATLRSLKELRDLLNAIEDYLKKNK